jgi:predicted TIM-barrel fold metal-dependent hydrolase
MRNGYSIFDTHTHVGAARHSGRRYTADQLLADMDRAGVDRAVVIPFPVVEDERAAHDEIGAAVLKHGDRLTGAACLYPYRDGFRDEARRCRERYGFRALKIQPQYQPLNPLSPASGFLFETAIENGMALIVHTGAGAPYALPSLWMPAARRYPDLKVVLAHAGGGIYYGEAIVAALFCPNVYLELSTLAPHHVSEVLKHLPSSRLMIGSDLPESLEIEIGKILPRPEARDILSATAERVFL